MQAKTQFLYSAIDHGIYYRVQKPRKDVFDKRADVVLAV